MFWVLVMRPTTTLQAKQFPSLFSLFCLSHWQQFRYLILWMTIRAVFMTLVYLTYLSLVSINDLLTINLKKVCNRYGKKQYTLSNYVLFMRAFTLWQVTWMTLCCKKFSYLTNCSVTCFMDMWWNMYNGILTHNIDTVGYYELNTITSTHSFY